MNKTFSFKDMFPIIKEQLESGGSATFTIHGTSMLPMLKDRKDSVTIKKPLSKPKKYDIIFYRRANGSFILHRIVGIKGGAFICRGDNQTEKEFPVTESSVIGIVESYTKNGRKIGFGSCRQFIYSRLKVNTVWLLKLFRGAKGLLRRIAGKK